MKVCSKVLGETSTSVPLQEKAAQFLVCKSNTYNYCRGVMWDFWDRKHLFDNHRVHNNKYNIKENGIEHNTLNSHIKTKKERKTLPELVRDRRDKMRMESGLDAVFSCLR